MGQKAYNLIQAFFSSEEEGLRLLNSEPDLLSERTGLGETVLHYLVVENQLALVQALIQKKGADINTLNDFGNSPLSEAASLGYLDMVNYLLSKGAKLKIPEQTDVVLHAAVRSNNVAVVKAVLNAGAAVNEIGESDETALHLAAESSSPEIALVLIDAGADIRARRIFDETPLDVAQRSSSPETAEILRKAISKTS